MNRASLVLTAAVLLAAAGVAYHVGYAHGLKAHTESLYTWSDVSGSMESGGISIEPGATLKWPDNCQDDGVHVVCTGTSAPENVITLPEQKAEQR